MSKANQPIEVQAVQSLASLITEYFVGNKADAEQSKINRTNRFEDIRTTCVSIGVVNELDVITVQDAFMKAAKVAGLKAASIKVVKSEIGRIMSNIALVPEDCTSWKSALKAIREATTDSITLMVDEAEKLMESIRKSEETLSNLVMELADDNQWSPEFAADYIRKCISERKNVAVAPRNVAYLLRQDAEVKAGPVDGAKPASLKVANG